MLAPIYARLAPELENRAVKPGAGHASVEVAVAGIAANGAFEAPARARSSRGRQRYDAAGWRELLGTHSDHLTLAADRRERLLDAVEAAIDSIGGSLVMPYEAMLVEARRISGPFSRSASLTPRAPASARCESTRAACC